MACPTANLTTIFVYGTLMRGECRHSVLRGQQFVSAASTEPRYRLLMVDDYPGLVDAPEGKGVSIVGELWQVDQQHLQRLDAVECVDDGLYERQKVQLLEPSGSADAWFYLQNTTMLEDLGNDWRSR